MALTRWKNTVMCSCCHRSWHFMTGKTRDDATAPVAAEVCPYADCPSNRSDEALPRFSYGGFEDLASAQAYKRQFGGWIFQANNGQVIWFDASRFTPSQIFAHPATRGLAGCLL